MAEQLTVHEAWATHPFVIEATQRSGGDLAGTLVALHETLTELDARFPGLPLAKILANQDRPEGTTRQHPRRAAALMMLAEGRTTREIRAALYEGREPSSREEIYRWADTDLTPTEICRETGQPAFFGRKASFLRIGLSEPQLECLEHMKRHPMKGSHLLAQNSAHKCAQYDRTWAKVEYRITRGMDL